MSGVIARSHKDGTVDVIVARSDYPQIAAHWESQLTGSNARKWGRIWIDPSTKARDQRRRDALWQEGPSTRGVPAFNRDECPGAMFICHTQEISHVEVVCASENQAFGRDLYQALRKELGPRMAWWEVRFEFVDTLSR
jgi:hypothetical protein